MVGLKLILIKLELKSLVNSERALTFVNMKNIPTILDFDWNKYETGDNLNKWNMGTKNNIFQIRDFFNYINLGNTSNNLKAKIGAHDVLMVKISK